MIRDKIYFFGILLLVIGLPFSKAFVSISYVILIATWLIDVSVLQKFGAFFKNKPALILASIYWLHLVGLLYTSDFSYAWLEVRTKIPLFILPLIFSTMRLPSRKEFVLILTVFALFVVASWGAAVFFLFKDSPLDFRDAFHFDSHIRLSVMAIISIAIFGWLSFSKQLNTPKWAKIAMVFLSAFLVWAIAILEVMSGLLLLVLSTIGVGLVFSFLQKNRFASAIKIGLPIFVLFVASLSFYIAHDYWSVKALSATAKTTLHGNVYENLEEEFPIENGSPIGRMVCWSEMEDGWNSISKIPFDSVNKTGYAVQYSLLRYLNSKHLSKDLEGVQQLTQADIRAIELGFANYEYTKKFSFKKRIYKLLWEYDMYKFGGDINSSSGLKRFMLWQTGIKIVANNILFGVGTGDVKVAFEEQLINDKSPLMKAGLRAHNQWISVAIAFGIFGFSWFVFAIIYPWVSMRRFDFLFIAFFVVYIISMFWEDSLETQIGVTIFGFLYPFLLFLNPFSPKPKLHN